MIIAPVMSTKGGVGKSTTVANLGAFCADAGKRVLLIDLDAQPTLSSYYRLESEAPGGIFEFVGSNETRLEQIVSKTNIPNLDIIISNDSKGQPDTLLLNAADGRLRLFNLLPRLKPHYDLVLIDTKPETTIKRGQTNTSTTNGTFQPGFKNDLTFSSKPYRALPFFSSSRKAAGFLVSLDLRTFAHSSDSLMRVLRHFS